MGNIATSRGWLVMRLAVGVAERQSGELLRADRKARVVSEC